MKVVAQLAGSGETANKTTNKMAAKLGLSPRLMVTLVLKKTDCLLIPFCLQIYSYCYRNNDKDSLLNVSFVASFQKRGSVGEKRWMIRQVAI